MKAVVLFLLLGMSAPIALAGEVYGTISEAGKPVAAGIKVEISVGGSTYSGETDKFGTYHLYAKEKGKGTLTISVKDQKPSASIFSYDKATRYDWNVETVDGKLVLKRQ